MLYKKTDDGLIEVAGYQLAYDFKGTRAEYEVAKANGTIQDGWVIFITDDVNALGFGITSPKIGVQTIAAGGSINVDTGLTLNLSKAMVSMTYGAWSLVMTNLYTSGGKTIATLKNFSSSSITTTATDFITLRYIQF